MTVELQRRLFTVDEYHDMLRAGILSEDDRVELIAGQILKKMTIGSRHAAVVNRLNRRFTEQLADRVVVSVQNPVRLSDLSEPEPDIAILRPRPDFYSDAHPRPADVMLFVEVADSSLPFDREVKLPLYAVASIPEMWLVDLVEDRIVAHRRPTHGRYEEVEVYRPGDYIQPVALPELSLAVGEILGVAGG
ncbi:MAG: Uma2 family endonuclease [Gemmatimonadetes bacterium]|nr:Uma2 family endonuclease [Gemmatimonadota bacterium]